MRCWTCGRYARMTAAAGAAALGQHRLEATHRCNIASRPAERARRARARAGAAGDAVASERPRSQQLRRRRSSAFGGRRPLAVGRLRLPVVAASHGRRPPVVGLTAFGRSSTSVVRRSSVVNRRRSSTAVNQHRASVVVGRRRSSIAVGHRPSSSSVADATAGASHCMACQNFRPKFGRNRQVGVHANFGRCPFLR